MEKWKKSVPKEVQSNDVSTSSDDDDLCEKYQTILFNVQQIVLQ